MADNRYDEAVDIVAQHVNARAVEDFSYDMAYNDIGNDDWVAISKRCVERVPYPELARYEAARDFLASRAKGETS